MLVSLYLHVFTLHFLIHSHDPSHSSVRLPKQIFKTIMTRRKLRFFGRTRPDKPSTYLMLNSLSLPSTTRNKRLVKLKAAGTRCMNCLPVSSQVAPKGEFP